MEFIRFRFTNLKWSTPDLDSSELYFGWGQKTVLVTHWPETKTLKRWKGVERNIACGTCSKCHLGITYHENETHLDKRGCIKCSVQDLSAWNKRSLNSFAKRLCGTARSLQGLSPFFPKLPTTIPWQSRLKPGVVAAKGIFFSNFSAQLVAKSKQIQGVGPEKNTGNIGKHHSGNNRLHGKSSFLRPGMNLNIYMIIWY